MQYKALTSFASAAVSMYKGEVKEITDEGVVKDLLRACYIETVAEPISSGLPPTVSEEDEITETTNNADKTENIEPIKEVEETQTKKPKGEKAVKADESK